MEAEEMPRMLMWSLVREENNELQFTFLLDGQVDCLQLDHELGYPELLHDISIYVRYQYPTLINFWFGDPSANWFDLLRTFELQVLSCRGHDLESVAWGHYTGRNSMSKLLSKYERQE